MTEEETLIDAGEAARLLRVSRRTVYRYAALGLLDGRRIGPKLIRVTARSVDALAKGKAR